MTGTRTPATVPLAPAGTLGPAIAEPGPLDTSGSFRRTSSAYLPWIGLTLLAVLLAFASALAITHRQHILDNERANTELVARTLEDLSSRHLDTVKLVLDNVGLRTRQLRSAQLAELDRDLPGAARTSPLIRSLSIVDDAGRIRASSAPDNHGAQIDMGRLLRPRSASQYRIGPWLPGRDLVPALVAPSQLAASATAGTPVPPRTLEQIGLSTLVHGASSADGENLHLVAALNTDFLGSAYELALQKSAKRAALVNIHGMVMAITDNARVQPGATIRFSPAMQELISQSEHGTFSGPGLDGNEAISAYRSLREHPWLLLVEQPTSDVISQWRDDVGWLLAASLLLALLISAATGAAWRSLRTHEALERELAGTKAGLEEKERSLRAVIEAAPAPMFVLDAMGHYAMVNQAFEDFLGVEREQLLGTGLPLAAHLQQLAYHPLHDNAVWKGRGRSHYLDDLPGADGRLREALVSKVAILREDGRPNAVIGSITDVTELREAERHTREAMQKAQQASESKNEFIANMSHGLRTPLQSVLGFAELGKWHSGEQPLLREMFDDIHRTGKRMLVMVNDLLDMSKLESTVGNMHRDVTDVVTLTTEVLSELKARATTQQVSLRTFGLLLPHDGPDSVASRSSANEQTAWADRMRLHQALRNVLDNALRFAPPGSAVDIDLDRGPDDRLHWTIKDAGPGVPDHEQAYVFEAFFHGLRNRDETGSFGLSLAIASKIMQAHGGSLWCENLPESGVAFHLHLPGGISGISGSAAVSEGATLATSSPRHHPFDA
ncbi:ATP-binding protein [Sphaerotilus mobilis]|uniref:histidine kinase n=1 Tax=Sphaerotilus mobilis TaxID=47994 RepID=A0A4Q7LBD3_9BURK|nr:ATP-binding protein [Sphaerotilus mobilis]RZS46711.1 PAS domain S-box-containing protein [Sphaerotilus mobilis]